MVSDFAPGLEAVHHVGISVADVDRSLAFWSAFLGIEPEWRSRLDGPYLGGVTGYDGIQLEAAVIRLPSGLALEILEYQTEDKVPNPDATANPGNVHLCLRTSDAAGLRRRAIDAGATPVSPELVEITAGPNRGACSCYLRDPDGITLELFQPAPA